MRLQNKNFKNLSRTFLGRFETLLLKRYQYRSSPA